VRLKVESLVAHAQNARTHAPEQIRQIADSIKRFGFTTPVIVDERGVLIAGHARVMASWLLGLDDPQLSRQSMAYPAQVVADLFGASPVLNARTLVARRQRCTPASMCWRRIGRRCGEVGAAMDPNAGFAAILRAIERDLLRLSHLNAAGVMAPRGQLRMSAK
jgi:hypothetical protein